MNTNPPTVPVSVVVLTRNEEVNVRACLQSVAWADEVFVVDSLSTDRTAEIAVSIGARVFFHPFEGYAKQRNWALDHLPLAHEWVLMLDADEQASLSLASEIADALSDQNCDGYYLKRRFFFLGKWMRHGGIYPTWILRLFKRHRVRFEDRPLNEHSILTGRTGYLEEPLDHRDGKSLSDWIAKHNRYAELEAEEFLQEMQAEAYASSIPARLCGSQAERKRWIKLRVWNRLPLFARPCLFFVRNYFLKLGFLDGRPGLIYHILWSFWVRFLIDAKIHEQRRRRSAAVPDGAIAPEGPDYSLTATASKLHEGEIRGHAGG